MDVLIDTSSLANPSGGRGIGRYTRELVAALRKLSTNHKFYTSEDRPRHVDVVHYPFFDLFFPTLPLFKNRKTIVTIHDVTPLVLARHYPVGVRGSLNLLRQQLALRGVAHVITDSQNSKRDISERLKFPHEKITAIPLAASDVFYRRSISEIDAVRKKYDVPKNYFLYVGDINYNKNLPFLINTAAKVPNITLVLVGRTLKDTSIPEGKAVERAIIQSGIGKYIRLLTQVDSQDELAALYSGAKAYVQPSLYEGFGLPVVEAMRCKTAVVSSRGGSLPEVVGGMGILFNPRDSAECESALRKILRLPDSQLSELTKRAFEYSQRFTWENTAKQTLAVYEKVGK